MQAGSLTSAPSVSRSPAEWWRLLGPGAVIASLTIGAGELIFSTRGGAIFGYDLLWFLLLVLIAKWVLLYTAARQMVLTGAHPLERWMDLPGPSGWLPVVFALLALIAFPIWVSFHAGTVGTLLAWLCGTETILGGTTHYLWGIGALGCVLVLSFRGGYATLERVQLVIVAVMLLAVTICLIMLNPPWMELFKGLFMPKALTYPSWAAEHPALSGRPVWVEAVTYVGVLGGSAYDYLAYVSYLRDKRWGRAGAPIATPVELDSAAARPELHRPWLRVLLMDCTLSFVAVLIFTCVFVTCGAMILGPQQKLPSGTNLLALQAEFVGQYPWMKTVYFAGAFLTIFGTLYGTVEVAPTVLRETMSALSSKNGSRRPEQLRRWAILWCGCGALIVLLASFLYALTRPSGTMPGLIAVLTPANLFTGVLGCGLICLLNPWIESRVLPRALRMHPVLRILNWLAGLAFVALGLKAYWDHSGWPSFAILGGTLLLGGLWAKTMNRRR